MAEKSIAICLNNKCGERIESEFLSHENCPKCSKPLLWVCPACGGKFINKSQMFCGRRGCPASDLLINLTIEAIEGTLPKRKIKPANLEVLELIKPFLKEETYKYWKEELAKEG